MIKQINLGRIILAHGGQNIEVQLNSGKLFGGGEGWKGNWTRWTSSVPPSFWENEDTLVHECTLIVCYLHVYSFFFFSFALAQINSLNTDLSKSALSWISSSKEVDKQIHKIQMTKIT